MRTTKYGKEGQEGKNLVTKLIFDILFHSPKHEGLQDHVEARELIPIHAALSLGMALDVLGKPL